MQLKFIKFVFAFLLMSTTVIYCLAQDKLSTRDKNIKLLAWKTSPCDKEYVTDRLINRITSIQKRNDTTYITVNFADNSCAVFKPNIIFSDTSLMLFAYEKYIGEKCDENCTFTIEYAISGLSEKTYSIYFQGKKIEVSSNYYALVEPKDTIYKGEKINRTNKYGFREGIHMTFYETGEIQRIWKFPEVVENYGDEFFWCKGYYVSGKLYFHNRKDTSQQWFEDGEVKSEHIKYTIGDTIFDRDFSKFEDRTKANKSFERSYPIFNSQGEIINFIIEKIYEESYYSDGKPHFLYGTDTTYCWYENGQLSYKENASYKISYTQEGIENHRWYRWVENDTGKWKDIKHLLSIRFYENGNIKEIYFERDELSANGKKIKEDIEYYWVWNREKKLTESPGKWKGEYPWKRFEEVNLLLKTYELH